MNPILEFQVVVAKTETRTVMARSHEEAANTVRAGLHQGEGYVVGTNLNKPTPPPPLDGDWPFDPLIPAGSMDSCA